jgi:hypothetical protein
MEEVREFRKCLAGELLVGFEAQPIRMFPALLGKRPLLLVESLECGIFGVAEHTDDLLASPTE